MDAEVATASRDVLRIKARRCADLMFRRARKVARVSRESSGSDSILLHPTIEEEDIGDVYNRLGWYLPKRTLRSGITIRVQNSRRDTQPKEKGVPDYQPEYNTGHLPVETGDDVPASDLGRFDVHLVREANAILRPQMFRIIDRTEVVDPDYYNTVEPSTWGRVSSDLRQDVRQNSKTHFRGLERTHEETERAFVFGTGPSLEAAYDYEFPDDALTVVCNSIVRNDELLDLIDPDVLTFADPVFHFGPSRYADQFRTDAVETLREYDCVGIIPSQHHSLMTGHFPDCEFVGVESRPYETPNYPTADDRTVMGTGNIMTLLMLPVASALADEVYVLGATGREADESYFWEHSDDAQYDDDLMNSAAECHPAFFRDRIYTDYYAEHVRTLTDMIEYGEERGVSYYNLTDSYIPCLRERRVDPETGGVEPGR